MSDIPEVSIVVPAFNESYGIRRCLEAICRGTYRDFELIVVDDASSDDTRERVARCMDPRVCLLANSTNVGPAHSRNRGVEVSRGRYILFVDADCLPVSDWVEQAVAALQQTGVCAVEGAVRYEISAPHLWQKVPLNPFYNLDSGDALTVANRDYANGNLGVARECFDRAGGFNADRYPNGREDTDLGLRLSRLGKVHYNPRMIVTHRSESWTVRALLRNARRYAGDVRIFKDHGRFPFIRGRVIHPRFLLLLLCPPLIFKYYRIRLLRDLCFVPKFLLYLLAVRLVIWRTAIDERIVLL